MGLVAGLACISFVCLRRGGLGSYAVSEGIRFDMV